MDATQWGEIKQSGSKPWLIFHSDSFIFEQQFIPKNVVNMLLKPELVFNDLANKHTRGIVSK